VKDTAAQSLTGIYHLHHNIIEMHDKSDVTIPQQFERYNAFVYIKLKGGLVSGTSVEVYI
jgi:hypothetical protein